MNPRVPEELPGLLVTGTDTGVGKTWISSVIVRALTRSGRDVAVLKPLATGATREGDSWRHPDAEALLAARGGDVADAVRVSPLLFIEPMAPSVAARRSGRPLTLDDVRQAVTEARGWWATRGADIIVIEGVGGLLCPIAEEATVADRALALDYPLVIVARLGLGTLNHTLMTVESAQRRGLRIAGVVVNASEPPSGSIAEQTNPGELARWLRTVPILGVAGHDPASGGLPDALASVDWMGLARPARWRPASSAPA